MLVHVVPLTARQLGEPAGFVDILKDHVAVRGGAGLYDRQVFTRHDEVGTAGQRSEETVEGFGVGNGHPSRDLERRSTRRYFRPTTPH